MAAMNRRSFLAGVLGIGGAGCVLGSEVEPAAPGLTYTGTGEPVRTSQTVEGKLIEYQMHLNSVPTWSGTFNSNPRYHGEITWTQDSWVIE